jgi:hypothetical protein
MAQPGIGLDQEGQELGTPHQLAEPGPVKLRPASFRQGVDSAGVY